MTKDGKGYIKAIRPRGETEDNAPRAFINNSSYALTYPVYGAIPEANKRPQKLFAPGYGKLANVTAYNATFSNSPDAKYRAEKSEEKIRVKAYQRKQVGGQLKPTVPF